MKRLFFALLVCCFLSESQARYTIPKKEKALEFLKRTILVQIKEYDKEELKKLKFETYEEDYKIFLSEFNGSFQYAVKHYWKLGNKVEFKTKAEIDELLKKDKSKYAVIRDSFATRKRVTKSAKVTYVTHFKVYQFTATIDDKEIFWLPMPTCFLTPADFTYIVQQFNIYMEAGKNGMKQGKFFKIGDNLDTLKNNKILLLPNYWLAEEMNEEKIKKNYGYPYKIVGYADIEEAVRNQDARYAYVTFIYCAVLENPSWVTVDAATGRILTLVTEGGIDIGIVFLPPKKERQYESKAPRTTIYKSVWGKNIGGGMLMGFRSKFAQMLNKK